MEHYKNKTQKSIITSNKIWKIANNLTKLQQPITKENIKLVANGKACSLSKDCGM